MSVFVQDLPDGNICICTYDQGKTLFDGRKDQTLCQRCFCNPYQFYTFFCKSIKTEPAVLEKNFPDQLHTICKEILFCHAGPVGEIGEDETYTQKLCRVLCQKPTASVSCELNETS